MVVEQAGRQWALEDGDAETNILIAKLFLWSRESEGGRGFCISCTLGRRAWKCLTTAVVFFAYGRTVMKGISMSTLLLEHSSLFQEVSVVLLMPSDSWALMLA
jgi:hypothetical protein